MSEVPHRRRGKTIVSLIFFLVIMAKHGDQPAAENGLAGFVSTLRVIPEVAGELAQALGALLSAGSR